MSKQNEALQSDPSMDDILSSIREIISDDVKLSTAGPKTMSANSNNNNHNKEGDVLDLTDMIKDDGSVVSIQREEPMFEDTKKDEDVTDTLELTEADVAETTEESGGSDLISDSALAESMSALQGLDSISDEALQQVGDNFDGSKTVEMLMVDILRPMLREWIDANLPSLVKVIVNEQVEKVMQSRIGAAANQSVEAPEAMEEEAHAAEG